MITVRSALFYKILANSVSKREFVQSLQNIQATIDSFKEDDTYDMERVYKLITEAAVRGRIRILLNSNDTIWKNKKALKEMESHGFNVLKPYDMTIGVIEWK